jgi:hypothetical protein
MKKYDGLVLNVEKLFVFISDIAIIVGNNDSFCLILATKMILKSSKRGIVFL